MGSAVSTLRHTHTVLTGPTPGNADEQQLFATSLAVPGLWVSSHEGARLPPGYQNRTDMLRAIHPLLRGMAKGLATQPRSSAHALLDEAAFQLQIDRGCPQLTPVRLARLIANARGTADIRLMLWLARTHILNLNCPLPMHPHRASLGSEPEMGHAAHLLARHGNGGLHSHDKPISLKRCFLMLKQLAGGQLDLPGERGRTPLHEAVLASNHKTLRALLRAGVMVDAVDAGGYTALGRALDMRDTTACELLSAAGARYYSIGEHPPVSSSAWISQRQQRLARAD